MTRRTSPLPDPTQKTHPLHAFHHNGLTARLVAIVSLVSVAFLTSPVVAQEEREPGWYDTAELSFLTTTGNSETDTLSLNNTLERLWENSRFKLSASALRAESSTSRFSARLTDGEVVIREFTQTELTAENYAVRSRYDRDISERLFWYVGLDWESNEFAGFDSRSIGLVGAGHRWWSHDTSVFSTDYAVTYTIQDDLIEAPDADDSFLGARFSYEYKRSLNQSTTYGSDLILDLNLDETDDWRGDMNHWLAVDMTERLALKVNYRLLYDNLPSLTAVVVIPEDRAVLGNTILAELDDLDTALSIALVVSF